MLEISEFQHELIQRCLGVPLGRGEETWKERRVIQNQGLTFHAACLSCRQGAGKQSLIWNSLLAKAGTRTTRSTRSEDRLVVSSLKITPSELQGQFYCHCWHRGPQAVTLSCLPCPCPSKHLLCSPDPHTQGEDAEWSWAPLLPPHQPSQILLFIYSKTSRWPKL